MPIIVGAGIAGLYLAKRLENEGTIVLETRNMYGGRVRSEYDTSGRLLYEAGPWRVPENHHRTRALFAEYDITLRPLATPTVPHGPPSEKMAGMANWDVHALQGGPDYADKLDRATGYADQSSSASGSSPYTTTSRQFFVAPKGFSHLIEELASNTDIRLQHRVVNVTARNGIYVVECTVRTGHNSFVTRTFETTSLYVCVPPGACKNWTIFKTWAKSVMHSVVEGPLHHIYTNDKNHPKNRHTKTDDMLAQSISTQYENEWFQISYSGGRVARFWNNLKLSYPIIFAEKLKEYLFEKWQHKLADDAKIKSHFWPVALHQWVPVPLFDVERAMRKAIRPNPVHLPNVFLAGEAFSSHQAWMEGALETVDLLFEEEHEDAFRSSNVVYVEGVPIDVSKWIERHPGGFFALKNHLDEDVTLLMKQIRHSPHAWAVVHSLKA